MNVTLYTKPSCVQCNATHRASPPPASSTPPSTSPRTPTPRDYLLSLGYRQAPVVVADTDHWSGFRPDRIKTLSA
ncbi:NrdH-redoxin [Rhodococcus hoagii]|nr:NrdH-redoxin [Prescottella equi]